MPAVCADGADGLQSLNPGQEHDGYISDAQHL